VSRAITQEVLQRDTEEKEIRKEDMFVQVPGIGPKNAKIVICGEAPGVEEISHNPPTPFVGTDGNQLDQWLQRTGIDRASVYLTNVVKRKLQGNDFAQMYLDSKQLKPTPELLEYWEELERELKEINPNVIVPLGRQPLYAITGKDSIGKWRGSILESKWGTKVIATWHPGAIRREYSLRPSALNDMRRVKVESSHPIIKLPQRDYIIGPGLKETLDYIKACKGEIVAEDIETQHYSKITCLGLSYDPSHAICIPFVYEGKPYWSESSLVQIREALIELQQDPFTYKVMQNGHYDWSWLKRDGLGIDKLWFDTLTAQHVTWPEQPKDLAFLASIYTREPYWKDEGKDTHKRIVDWNSYWKYNCTDAAVTRELVDPLQNEINSTKTQELFDFEMSLIPIFVDATLKGFKCDVDKKKKMLKDCRTKLVDLQGKLDEALPEHWRCIRCGGAGEVEYGRKRKDGTKAIKSCKKEFKNGKWGNGCGGTGKHVNPDSPKQMAAVIYQYMGLPKSYHPKTKKVTVDENSIKKLQVKRPHPIFELYLQYTEASKDHDFLSCKISDDGRIRTTLSCNLKTGRLSSKASPFGDGTNCQNIKRDSDFRDLFIADDGYVLLGPDYEKAESYSMAYEANDSAYIAALERCSVCDGRGEKDCPICKGSGRGDVHTKNASVIFKKYPADITKDERSLGKKVGHGLDGMMGDRTLCESILKELGPKYAIAQKEAKLFRDAYFNTYSGLLKFQKFIEQELKVTRTIFNSFGRRRVSLGRPEGKTIRDLLRHIPQSTVADLTNRSIVRLPDLPYLTFLLQVHDSIICQVPIEHYKEAIKLLEEAMTMEITAVYSGLKYTIPIEMKIGYSWGSLMNVEEFEEQCVS
jgi:uracil-DNA glycosylase family 4